MANDSFNLFVSSFVSFSINGLKQNAENFNYFPILTLMARNACNGENGETGEPGIIQQY